jgi:GntR family transcriptional regulator/MocR family aminotransferase
MLTYSFDNKGNDSLYEFLYKSIRDDILSEKLRKQERLPSKRALAEHLGISTITVENAYNQLMAEGYIYSKPKSGYYVSPISSPSIYTAKDKNRYTAEEDEYSHKNYPADFTNNASAQYSFPFITWAKLMRQTLSEKQDKLILNSPSIGIRELRCAISDYLFQFRGMSADPDCIVIGAGTEYLYSLIIQLLGRDKKYVLEDTGYRKIAQIYKANNINFEYITLDSDGVDKKMLEKSDAQVLHISPSHHFPTGIVTPVSRRYELLSWAGELPERYIIEDDYDSEFRFSGKPIPSLQSIDNMHKVIYINTFSKSLASTIRISYMVLPEELMQRYKEELSFYSCTVSTFEQYTLAAFIKQGYFEKHINRMRNYYRTQRDMVMTAIKNHPFYSKVTIKEENSGLHFLMKIDTQLSDGELIQRARSNNVNLTCLSQYYHNCEKAPEHTLIINYSGLQKEDISEAIAKLFEVVIG